MHDKASAKIALADPLKLLGILGAIVYAGLFLAYDQFYAGVGVRPEDVGVTYLAVLVRSLGLGLLLTLLSSLASVSATMRTPGSLFSKEYSWRRLLFLYASTVAVVIVYNVLPHDFDEHGVSVFGIPLGALYVACIVLVVLQALMATALRIWKDRRGLSVPKYHRLVIHQVLVAIALFAGLAHYSAELAKTARAGHEVAAVRLLGLPLLDVEAKWVEVGWLGPATQRPPFMNASSPLCMLYIGQSSTDSFFLGKVHQSGQLDSVSIPVAGVSTNEASPNECPDILNAG